MTTTAQIAAKGCQGTGITEEIAKRLHDSLGKTIVIVAEISSDSRTENKAGDEKVKLVINNIEVAPDGTAAEHVRELSRLFHYERRLVAEGPELDLALDGPAPKPADVINARYTPHPYLASTLSTDDNAVCDVCGQVENAAIHADRDRMADPFATPAPGGQDEEDGAPEPPDPDDPAFEPHDFVDDGDGGCAVECGQPEDGPIHQPQEPAST